MVNFLCSHGKFLKEPHVDSSQVFPEKRDPGSCNFHDTQKIVPDRMARVASPPGSYRDLRPFGCPFGGSSLGASMAAQLK